MAAQPSSEGGQNPAYRSTHHPPISETNVLHLPYRELPVDDPGTPDRRSALRYLMWLARHQKGLLALNALFGILWMVSQALLWAAVGAAIDHGVARHDAASLWRWVGVVVAL